MSDRSCDYCGDGVVTKHDEIDRCDLCWEHHYNLLNPEYAAKNPVPPHKAKHPAPTKRVEATYHGTEAKEQA